MLKLREELGLTLLVVTHDLGLAWNIADRIVVMYLGRVVEQGPTEEVLSNPQHPYTRALLSVVPEMHGVEQIVLSGETPDPTRIPSGCRFHPRCQEVRDGVAEQAGVLAACSTISPAILPPSIPIGVNTDRPQPRGGVSPRRATTAGLSIAALDAGRGTARGRDRCCAGSGRRPAGYRGSLARPAAPHAGASPRTGRALPPAGRTARSGCRGRAPRATRPAEPGRS